MRIIAVFVFLLCSSIAYCLLLTVDNNLPSIGQYQSLQSAVDAAQTDDVIYVYPSSVTHPTLNLSKRVTIYGAGWQKLMNPVLIKYSSLESINFNSGSEHSYIIGLCIGTCTVTEADVTIKNCKIASLALFGNNTQIVSTELNLCHIYSGAVSNSLSKCFIPGQLIVHNGSSSAVVNCIFSSTAGYVFIGIESYAICTFIRNTIATRGNYAPQDMVFEHNLLLDIGHPNSAYHNTLMTQDYQLFVQGNTLLDNSRPWIECLNQNEPDFHIRDVPTESVLEFIYLYDVNGQPHITPIPDTTPPEDGAYTGSDPFDDNYNIPDLPMIIELTIENATVQQNQNLQVEIKAVSK